MTIPIRKIGEPENAFITRSYKEGATPKECAEGWAALAAEETYTLEAEILAAGKWNGIDFTKAHMEQAVNNFRALRAVVDVPLKLGHNKKQAMTDGHPALGWVDDVWVKSGKVMARFTDMPKILFEAIKKKRYKNVSIEGLQDVNYKGKDYGFVLTAVALLGVDMPAVNTLSDLQTYLTADNDLQFVNQVNFSINNGGGQMTPEEEVALRAELATANAANITLKAENTVVLAAKKKAEDEQLTSNKLALFTAAKVELVAAGNTLVKEGKATPAQRDMVLKDLTEEGLEFAKKTFETLGLSVGNGVDTSSQAAGGGNSEDENLAPDEVLHAKTLEFAAKNGGCDYITANDAVLAADPKLAREYADMTGNNNT